MAPDSTARSARPGLSLYANLLDPSSNKDITPGTISRAPVVFKQPAEEDPARNKLAAEKQQINAGRYMPASVRGRYNYAEWNGSHFALSCNIQLLYAFNQQKGHTYQHKKQNRSLRQRKYRR